MSLFSAQSTATQECKPTMPASQVISVVAGLLKPLARNLRESSTLAFHDIDAALVASATFPDNEVISIQDSDCSVQNGLLYVFGCPTGQVSALSNMVSIMWTVPSLWPTCRLIHVQEEDALPLVKRWRGWAVVWVSFDMRSMEHRLTSSRRTFETVFAFEPLAVKVNQPQPRGNFVLKRCR